MAEIRPFRGVLYDPTKIGDIANVVAPPYDVIDAAEQTALHAKHPSNVIRLELGQDQPGDKGEENRYTRARRFLSEWLENGTLRQDNAPAIYLYEIQYRLRSGEERIMRGFLSLVRLEDFGTGRIFPHENTRAAAKSDRYQLLETCRSNFSPIFSLYSDAKGRIIGLLEKAVDKEKPRFEMTDNAGARHQVWSVTDQNALGDVVSLMKPLPLFIADGHHRYESALRYRNAQRAAHPGQSGDLPSDQVLMYFSNLDDSGLTILATHRLVPPPLSIPLQELRKRVGQNFTLQTFPFTKDTETGVRERFLGALHAAQSTNAHTMGLVVRGETRYDLLTLNPAAEAKLGPSARDRLDVTILQRLFLHEAMNMTPEDEERLTYLKDEEEVLNAVADGRAELAILLNPPKITEVKDVAGAEDRMPHKSTYFYPKPLTGFVIHVMDPTPRSI
ncbi:MAG TPA: DUF1015 domain-containing protein [Nitrospirales bacterium]|jgi:uncharacterized protein (DUF1015 family)